MGFRGISAREVRELLGTWLAGQGLRRVAEGTGVDRKTARRYVAAGLTAGVDRDAGPEQLTDELVSRTMVAARPVRTGRYGQSWTTLESQEDRIAGWVASGLSVVEIGTRLGNQGVDVPYRTLHRFCVERCGFARQSANARASSPVTPVDIPDRGGRDGV